jgi:hypothetical protein
MNLGMTADDMYEFLGGRVSKRDLYPFEFPQRKELMKIKCRSICLGNYIKWDTRKQVEIIKKELGWKPQPVEGVAPEYNYDKTECCFQGMRDYCRYIKRGYGRTAHLASVDVRNNRKTREEAWKLAQKYDGKRPASIKWFLDILQITEKDFFEIIMKHQVDPWKFDPSKVETVDPLQDMDKWDRTQVDEPKVGLTKNNVGKTGTYI